MLTLTLSSINIYASEFVYPDHWWDKVDTNDAPGWEIFPHQAIKGKEVILSKRNELGQNLSNLAHTPFSFRGKTYQCVEGLWQSLKYPEGPKDPRAIHPEVIWEFSREEVEQMIGWDAMNAGALGGQNMYVMGINWVSFEGKKMKYGTVGKGLHYQLIKSILKAKVETNPEVKRVLMSTGNLILKSDHIMGRDTPPAWKYHKIYMEIRNELRELNK